MMFRCPWKTWRITLLLGCWAGAWRNDTVTSWRDAWRRRQNGIQSLMIDTPLAYREWLTRAYPKENVETEINVNPTFYWHRVYLFPFFLLQLNKQMKVWCASTVVHTNTGIVASIQSANATQWDSIWCSAHRCTLLRLNSHSVPSAKVAIT